MEVEKLDEPREPSEGKEGKELEEGEARVYAREASTLEPHMAAALCYSLGWLSALIIFFVEKRSRYVKFHAIQALLWSVGALIVWLILGILWVVLVPLGVANFFFKIIGMIIMVTFFGWGIGNVYMWLILMFKAYKGEWHKIPILGDKAEEIA